jgi:hypothetical protein
MFTQTFVTLAALAASVVALPAVVRDVSFWPPTDKTGCKVSASVLQALLPANQTQLVAPSSDPSFVVLGVGVQNYTCSAAGTFTNIGAYAELFDISCLDKWAFASVQDSAFKQWNASAQTVQQLVDAFKGNRDVDGQHYFITNPAGTGANVPKFDFTSAKFKGNADAFAVMTKAGDIPAPTGAKDVDWLLLNPGPTSGKLASQIFRVTTVAGVAPSSCTAGETKVVKYVAKYFFYGSSL